jgi:leucine-rich PPR motif-containing protein
MELLQEMKQHGIPRNVVIYSSLMHGHASKHDPEGGRALLSAMIDDGVMPNAYTFASLINCYIKNKDLHGAVKCLEQVVDTVPTAISPVLFNIIIDGYVKVCSYWLIYDIFCFWN